MTGRWTGGLFLILRWGTRARERDSGFRLAHPVLPWYSAWPSLLCTPSPFVLIIMAAILVPLTPWNAWGNEPSASPALPAEASTNWWGDVQQNLKQTEYNLTETSEGAETTCRLFQAPNRAHDLRTTFDESGIHIGPRNSGKAAWSWGLALQGIETKNGKQPVAPPERVIQGNRIEYRRGTLTEWYINETAGLEQGFTLAEAPDGGTEDLTLVLAMSGDTLVSAVQQDGIVLSHPDQGVVLHFGQLLATDATGRELPSLFSVQDNTLRIHVATADAVYPVVIDPLATSPAWQGEGNITGANYGFSVASAGDVNGDGYGDVIVGAPEYDNGQSREGAAFLYLGSPDGLSTTASWQIECNQTLCLYGMSVASAGDVNGDGYGDVIVGASFYDNQEAVDEGTAFVYLGSAAGLATTPSWQGKGNQTISYYGFSVTSAGDVNGDGYGDVIVGAPVEDAAFLYLGSASGLSTVVAWQGEGKQLDASYGWSVAAAGDVNGDGYGDVIVGEYGYDNGQEDEGIAYLYLGSSSGLSTTAVWQVESNLDYAFYGEAVASAGDVNGDGFDDVIVGARAYNFSEGVVFLYFGSAGGLSLTSVWQKSGSQNGENYGFSVASAGDVNGDGYGDVIIGAHGHDDLVYSEGAAFIFNGSSNGLHLTPEWQTNGTQVESGYGHSVASAGDVNGDGYSDIIIGAFKYDNGETEEGAAFLYLGPIQDNDNDGINDSVDNCPLVTNAEQTDTDGDELGDLCDTDDDNDSILDGDDNCPYVANISQLNTDEDSFGNVCDTDDDGDTIIDVADNCPVVWNFNQLNMDGDSFGDTCDTDDDNDSILDGVDNCPQVINTSQSNIDGDSFGNACDTDDDNDTILDDSDNCSSLINTDQSNTDGDSFGDICDTDDDGDSVVDETDNCPVVANNNQSNMDGDSFGDICDTDNDNDAILDDSDNCPLLINIDQSNNDGDSSGDACDMDDDNDSILDGIDNCQYMPNSNQQDANGNNIGDTCEVDDDGFMNLLPVIKKILNN